MTDDLVKRLRDLNDHMNTFILDEAADRIEKDAQHIDEMYGLVAAMNADHLTNKTRIEQLEAANLKASLIKVDDELRIEQLEAELHSCFHRIEELQAALREHADEVNIAFQMGAEWERAHTKARIEKLEAALRRIRLHSREAWECKIANEALDAK
jgi:hypothetical protein